MTPMKRSRSLLMVWATALGVSLASAQNLSTMTPAQAAAAAQAAQAAGKTFGSTSITSGTTTPSNIATKGMAPGGNNIMGGQYTGTADPALMGLSTNPSLVTTGQAAKTASVNGFVGYSNTAADQGNQAAYFVTNTPIPITAISPSDSIAMTAAAPAVPAGIASSSSVICHTTVANTPFDPSIHYTCNETYNQYVTSCSLDKTISIKTTPACNVALTTNTLAGLSHSPTVECNGSLKIVVNLGTIPASTQCHSGGCNSNYYEYILTITQGSPISACKTLAINYKGNAWLSMCALYDGANTLTIDKFWDGTTTTVAVVPTNDHGPTSAQVKNYNPGGVITFSGGNYMQPQVVNGADANNCLSLNGLL